MVCRVGTRNAPLVNPVDCPLTEIAVTVPPEMYTVASEGPKFSEAVADAGTDHVIPKFVVAAAEEPTGDNTKSLRT